MTDQQAHMLADMPDNLKVAMIAALDRDLAQAGYTVISDPIADEILDYTPIGKRQD